MMQSKVFTNQRGIVEIIAIIVVLALAAVGGGYYLSQTSKNKASQQIGAAASDRRISLPTPSSDASQSYSQSLTSTNSPSPSPEITVSPAPADGQGWKTYIKDTAGYSFRYPADWTVVSTGSGCGPEFYPPGVKKVWVTVCGLYTNADETPANMASTSIGSNLSSLVSRNETIVGDHSAIDQQIKLSSEQSDEEVYVQGVRAKGGGQGTLAIYLHIQDLSQQTSSKTTFGQILQTFKFNY